MPDSELILSQVDIFKDLLEATFQGYASGRIPMHADIVVGAAASILTFRNFGEGFALDCADALQDLSRLSFEPYHLEPLNLLPSFELLWFRDCVKTFISYKKGTLSRWESSPSATPDGLLFRLGWEEVLPGDVILSAKKVREIAGRVISLYVLERKPDIWFNGERISY